MKFTKGKLLPICLAIVAVVIIAITVFKVSIGNLFFFAILAACPLMHIFMMKGHGDHDQKEKDAAKQSSKSCH